MEAETPALSATAPQAMDAYLLPLETPCAYYVPGAVSDADADAAYRDLLADTPWEKTAKINRWVTLMELPQDGDEEAEGAEGRGYKYRDAPGAALVGFPPALHLLKRRAEAWYNGHRAAAAAAADPDAATPAPVSFNVALLNYYEDGAQRIGWHADREELGRTTPIAAFSLGATRRFLLRSQTDGARDRAAVDVTHGSLLVMENACQRRYLHSVPKETKDCGGRINVTFRCKGGAAGGGSAGGTTGTTGTTLGELEHEKRDRWMSQIKTEEGAADATAGAWRAAAGAGGDDDGATTAEAGGAVFGDGVQFHDPSSRPDAALAASVAYLVKTNVGAECYCAAEAEEALDGERYTVVARPFGTAGYVAACAIGGTVAGGPEEGPVDATAEGALLQLRTAHHVLRYHDHFDLSGVPASPADGAEGDEGADGAGDDADGAAEDGDGDPDADGAAAGDADGAAPDRAAGDGDADAAEDDAAATAARDALRGLTGEDLYAYYKARLVAGRAGVPSLAALPRGGTFRATCERIGDHRFQAPEVEREIGGAMSEYYPHVKPRMLEFDVQVRVDVVGTKVVVGTQVNVEDLSKRHFLRFRNAVTIKTNLAYAMLRCANVRRGDLVVDPFCGSGTILLEALEFYQKQIQCVGMDVSRRSADGAQANARAEGFGDDVCSFHCCDARNFKHKLEVESVGAIVTNLPWGIMTGHKNVSDLQSMYEIFLRTAWYVLKDKARIVMLVLRGLQLTRIVRKLSGRYRLISVNCVRTTNNLPSIVVVEKLAVDEVRVAVKRQLGYLAQFVNHSSEMYHAVHYEKIDETTR